MFDLQVACTMIMQERCHKHDPLTYFQPSMPRRSPDWRPLPGGCTWMRGGLYSRMRTTWPQLQRVISAPSALPQWRVDLCKWHLPANTAYTVQKSCKLYRSAEQSFGRPLSGVQSWCKVRCLSTTVPVFCVRCWPSCLAGVPLTVA